MEVPQEKYNLVITDSYSKKKNGILRNIAEYPSAHKCTSSKFSKNKNLQKKLSKGVNTVNTVKKVYEKTCS